MTTIQPPLPTPLPAVPDAFIGGREPIDFWAPPAGTLVGIPQGSHVYLLTWSIDADRLAVYVGQSNDLRRRMAEYHRALQPRCPDDRKLAFLQRWLEARWPGGRLGLHWAPAPEDAPARHAEESRWIAALRPLGNGKGRQNLPEQRLLEDAYARYYAAYFDRMATL